MKTIFAGNWKMYGTIGETLKRLTELANKIKEAGVAQDRATIIVAPPFTALYSAAIALQGTDIRLAAQNVHWETEGAFTGEVSGIFLREIDCEYAIVGHSERRHIFKETDEMIGKKLPTAIASELKPIFCIGEALSERERGETFSVIERQIKSGLRELQMFDLKEVIIAYEPVWAIGTGKNATSKEIAEVHHFIRNLIAKMYDAPTANVMPILYGGSVKSRNAGEILNTKNVDGVLVGGASLNVNEFVNIIKAKGE